MTGATAMEVLYPRCSGLDIHKRFLVACLSLVQANGHRHKELRRFSTMTNEILALKEWLKASGCTHIAMESTGVYWKPIFHQLEDSFEIVLVNAQHMKAVAFPKNGRERCGMDRGSAPTWLVESLIHAKR
jgi:transposase